MADTHLMIFAGAGASYDSDGQRPPTWGNVQTHSGMRQVEQYAMSRIPQADDLFGLPFRHIRQRYARIQPLVAEVNSRKDGESVEYVLGQIQEESHQDKNVLRQLQAAKFYIRDVIQEREAAWCNNGQTETNWMLLIQKLRRHLQPDPQFKITIATTNYDGLIEDALSRYPKESIRSMSHYIDNDRINVLKLHGSTDWVRVAPAYGGQPDVVEAQTAIDEVERIKEDSNIYTLRSADESETVRRYLRIPALAIPVQNKVEYMCPMPVLNRFKERLKIATNLLVIGWRGQDKHIADLMKEGMPNLRHVTLVGVDMQDLDELRARILPSQRFPLMDTVNYSLSGFTGFVHRDDAYERFVNMVHTGNNA